MNNGDGTFTDEVLDWGIGVVHRGKGVAVGDFNGDGRLDWYVTSIYAPSISWTGNKLYLNQGGHTFVETAEAAGVDDGGYGWGSVAVDFDHDRRLDIAETNGSNGTFSDEPAYLWMQNALGTFDEMAWEAGLQHDGQGRGMVRLDYDNDGDQDGSVGFTDLIQLLAAWGPCAACPEDLNDDGGVGFVDLTLVLAGWGPCR